MIRVINRHGAFCHGLQPGAVGEVDETNVGVKSALAGKLLVRVEAPVQVAAARPIDDGERAQFDLFARESAAKLSERDERIAALEADLARLQADLDGLLNAPAKVDAPAPAEKPAPKSRAAREG